MDGVVFVEVVDNVGDERRLNASVQLTPQRGKVLAFVKNRDNDRQRTSIARRHQICPTSICSATQGITSSRTSDKAVGALNPSTRSALVTFGDRSCTSCSYGASLIKRKGFADPCTFFQINSANSRTVVLAEVERLKS